LEPRYAAVLPQHLGKHRGEGDSPDAAIALGVPDTEDVLDEVDVAPAQPPELLAPHAGQHERPEHAPRLLVGEGSGNAADFLRLQDPPLPPRQLRPFRSGCPVRLDELLALRGSEDGVQHRHVPSDRRRPKLVALLGKVRGDVARPDRVQRQRSERVLKPLPDAPVLRNGRRLPPPPRLTLREPSLCVGLERQGARLPPARPLDVCEPVP
jgi:hypothetical protein